jgi:outer membrane protein assembly factor BamB
VWNLNFAVTGASDDEKSAFGILAHDWSPRSAYLAIQAYLQQQAADQRQRIPDLQGIPYTFDWLVVTEGKVHTPPTIGPDGTIYVGSDLGRFYAISPSGGLRWIYHAAGGTRTAPAIQADGTLYVGDEHGSLTALRPDGQMIWQRDLGGSIRGTPQITGNALFVVTADGFATRLDLAGKTIWRTALGAAGAPAILRDDILYAATADGHVVAITSDGHIRWRAMLGHPIASGPTINAITPDPVLLIGDFDGYLTSLRLRDGQMIWQHKLAERIASPTISSASPLIAAPPLVGNDGMIYVGGRDGVLTAVDPAGTIHWRYLSGSDISATPMLGHDGLLYVGLYDQRLITLDHDGKPHWQAHVSGAVRTTPRYGSDDTLYVVTIGGVVYALTPQSVVQSTRMAAGL